MVLSMTGYGDAEATFEDLNFGVEIRCVNHRYFKAALKIPDWLQQFEPQLERLLRNKLGRGSINYHLKVRGAGQPTNNRIDVEVLQSYLDQLKPLLKGSKGELGIDLSSLIALPGVCSAVEEEERDHEQLWQFITQLTTQALENVLAMRRDEGQAMATDLLHHSAEIRKLVNQVALRAPLVVTDYRERLMVRINDLVRDKGLEIAEDDLLREISIFAERCDISEESTRLVSHLDQFDQLINSKEQGGRKLEFMAQEMLREANTIGSKANDASIARHVVEMKSLIDRLKEQVQNVE